MRRKTVELRRRCEVCCEPDEETPHRRYASGQVRCVRCKRHHAAAYMRRREVRARLQARP